jgi:hypothetical protein
VIELEPIKPHRDRDPAHEGGVVLADQEHAFADEIGRTASHSSSEEYQFAAQTQSASVACLQGTRSRSLARHLAAGNRGHNFGEEFSRLLTANLRA